MGRGFAAAVDRPCVGDGGTGAIGPGQLRRSCRDAVALRCQHLDLAGGRIDRGQRGILQAEGVVEVDNEAHVVPQSPLSDVAIKGKILEIIRDHDRFHDAQIKVKVKEGSVSLDGTFHYPRDAIFLKHRVAEIEGVISVQIEIAFRV